MSDYWKKRLEELNKSTDSKPSPAKKKDEQPSKTTEDSKDYWETKLAELRAAEKEKDEEDIAPTVGTLGSKKKEEERTWFQKGAFEDGYQFGDVTKTILGTFSDVGDNLGAGILGMGEKVVDALAYLAPGAATAGLYGSGGFFTSVEEQEAFNEAINESKDDVAKFIAKDLYDEEALAKKARANTGVINKILGVDSETYSVLGEKSDALVQSAGQLAATAGLQAVGVPWFVTTGVTSFGGELENALNQGASYEEAGLSAAISAGAEILTEKLSGGIKFGGKALDDALVSQLSRSISNKALRTMAKFGLDAVGEGAEEVISQVFSNLGSSLYKDESIGELLTSEEAMDEYLESFIGGAVLGGGSSSVNAINGKLSGVDAVTGLTKNEQKVVDHEYQKRVAEQEKNGKLTGKQKSDIYNKVLEDMDKGYISTDTIEEVLGGETYKSYKDTVDSEDAQIKELEAQIKELEDAPNTVGNSRKYDALTNQLEELKNNSQREQLKSRLGEEVSALVKGDRLVESYNERVRATQDFEADFDKYKGMKHEDAARKTLESAIALEASNTNRVHDMVDLAAKTAGDTGLSITFQTGEQIKADYIARQTEAINEIESIPEAERTAEQTELLAEMKDQLAKVESGEITVNGSITEDGIVLNIDSSNPLNRLVGHEVTHSLKKNAASYQALRDAMMKYAKDTNIDIDKKLAEYKARYAGVKGADPEVEMVADMVGDLLFSDADFVHRLSTENQTVFQWLWNEIKYLCKVATAGSQEARDLARVQKAFEDAYRNSGKQSNAQANAAAQTANKGFVGSVTGTTINAEQAKLLSGLSVEALQNAADLAGRRDITFSAIGLGGDTQTQQKWVDAGLAYVEQDADGDEYYVVYDAYLIDERARRNEAQKNTAKSGVEYSIHNNIVDVNGKKYDQVVVLDKTVSKSVLSNPKRFMEYIEKNLVGLEIPVSDAFGNQEVIEFARKDETVSKNGKRHPALGELAFTKGDTRKQVIVNAKEAIEASVHQPSWDSSENSHGWLDENGWESRSVYVLAQDGTIYNANLRIAKTRDGRNLLYAVNLNINDGVAVDMDATSKEAAVLAATPSEGSVPQAESKVKRDYSLSNSETDKTYLDAVNRGDTETAQKMVDEAAKAAGYTERLLHGTQSFGFTKLDLGQSDDGISFFATNSVDTAQSYSSLGGSRRISGEVDYAAIDEAIERNEKVAEENAYDLARKISDWAGYYGFVEGDYIHDKFIEVANDYKNGLSTREDADNEMYEFATEILSHGYYSDEHDGQAFWEWQDSDEADDIYTEVNKTIAKYFELADFEMNSVDSGNYDIYANTDNLLEIDCNGGNWDDIQSEVLPDIASDEYKKYGYRGHWDKWTTRSVSKYAKDIGYKGVKFKNLVDDGGRGVEVSKPADVYSFFDPQTQIKSADPVTYDENGNVIPLSERFNAKNDDILHSLSEDGDRFAPITDFDFFGKDFRKQDAPVQDTAPVREEATTMFPDDAPMPEDEETAHDRLASITDADMPPEVEAPIYANDPETVDNPFEDRDWNEVGRNRSEKAYMYENPEVKPFFQQEAEILLSEWQNTERGERMYVEGDFDGYGAESYYRFIGMKRNTSESIAEMRDSWDFSYDDIKKGLEAIIKDNGAENIAAAKRIEFMLNDRLMNGYKDFFSGQRVPPNQDYLNLLYEKQINEYSEESFERLMENADDYAPLADDVAPVTVAENATVDVAPVAEAYEAIKPKTQKEPRMARATPEEQARAQILTEEPKVDKKRPGAWNLFKDNFVDKGTIFETLSLKTGNRELQAKWKSIGRAESRAQWFMENGNAETSSLKSIRDTVEKSGKTQEFSEYLYHQHNVDRMNLVARNMDDVDKPVFGYDVTSEMSKKEAAKLEAANPEFKEWAEEVYAYNRSLRQSMVDSGVISQETADLWERKYPHYVPVRRKGDEGLNINVALDTKRTGVNAPVKKATGGNRDILPLFDTMAMRTEQTFKANARNRFGVELKNLIAPEVETEAVGVDEIIDSVDTHEELLQEGKNGRNPTFTVFENGEKVTFEIDEEMYDTMKPKSKAMSYTNKVLNKANNIRRGLLTEYNPAFMLTNPIKDTQDVMINSQHPARTYANYPKAISELLGKGQYYQEYMENGGEMNTYFDDDTKTFTPEKSGLSKVIGFPLEKISQANNFIERVPRMAEYIASRKEGRSIDVSMLDAARVTTDFSAGGDLVKFANRNGFTFLNASVQGAVQQVRNVREAKAEGAKGWAKLAAKVAVAGLPSLLLNHLLWDDDEDYEELSDYVKQNYYIVAKYGDGKFVRIPKGRALAVIQNAFEQMENLVTGNDEADFDTFGQFVIDSLKSTGKLALDNLAPSNPLENNLLAPIYQAKNNTTWYGEDLVPTRLQDLPAEEQYDETTDSLSKWLGEKLNISPYKINYVLDQYSGAIGDMFLPMMTPEAERGNDTLLGNMIAPVTDKFTTDSVMKNQNVSDFYDKRDELTTNAKASGATDEDVLMNKYMNSINSELSDLYGMKRSIQNGDLTKEEAWALQQMVKSSDISGEERHKLLHDLQTGELSDSTKYSLVRQIQGQIVDLTREGLDTYEGVSYETARDGEYANIGNRFFKKNDEGEWQKLSDEQVTKYKITSAAGDSVYATDGTTHFRWYEPGEDSTAEPGWRKLTDEQVAKQNKVTNGLGISAEQYWSNKEEYDFAYESPENYAVAKSVGGYKAYKGYSSDLYDIKADKDAKGNSITGSRKEKVLDYINNLDADYYTKIILWKNEYNSDDTYNEEIIEYLNGRNDISYEEMVAILKKLGFTVNGDNVSW